VLVAADFPLCSRHETTPDEALIDLLPAGDREMVRLQEQST
jgi:hypothetical protein